MAGRHVVLVLGGVRSGKSAAAERIVTKLGSPVTYIATAGVQDAEMARRVEVHRDRRDRSWRTVEAGRDLTAALVDSTGITLVDSLGTWLAAHPDLDPDVDGLIAALAARRQPTVVVSEEVGLSLVPTTRSGRSFQDSLGTINQRVAEIADRVVLVVAGRLLELG